jgi:hypothetical protein
MIFKSKIKQNTSIILLLLMSIRILLVPVVYVDFEMNKEFIIKNLCENRFNPNLRCDGKCILAKNLLKVSEENASNEAQKQSESIKKIMKESIQSCLSIYPEIQASLSFEVKRIFNIEHLPKGLSLFSIFHPPC